MGCVLLKFEYFKGFILDVLFSAQCSFGIFGGKFGTMNYVYNKFIAHIFSFH